jgi:hypothetical protein
MAALEIRIAAVLLAGLPTPAAAADELLLFSQRSFQGMTFRLEGSSASMAFAPRSVRVAEGSAWQLCPRPFFGGTCVTIDRPNPALALPRGFSGIVRSARPVASGGQGARPNDAGTGAAAPAARGEAPDP